MHPQGKVFFEMRIGAQTSQDPKIEPLFLSKELEDLALGLRLQFDRYKERLFDCYYQINKNIMPILRKLKEEDVCALKSNLFPPVVDPAYKIVEILKKKFIENGFLYLTTKDCPKLTVRHIPNRFYRCIRIEAAFSA